MMTPDQKQVLQLLDPIRVVVPWVLCEFVVFGPEFINRELVVGNQAELAKRVNDGDYELDNAALGAIWLRCLKMVRKIADKDRLTDIEALDRTISKAEEELGEQPPDYWLGEAFSAPTTAKVIQAPLESDGIAVIVKYVADEVIQSQLELDCCGNYNGDDVLYWFKNQLVVSISEDQRGLVSEAQDTAPTIAN